MIKQMAIVECDYSLCHFRQEVDNDIHDAANIQYPSNWVPLSVGTNGKNGYFCSQNCAIEWLKGNWPQGSIKYRSNKNSETGDIKMLEIK